MYIPGQALEAAADDAPCCGPPAGPPSSVFEKPGFRLCDFVGGFIKTAAGAVPRIKTGLTRSDHWGALCVRMGIGRNDYKVAPGLYALGHPDASAPVLVTANYKLGFDHLRHCMAGIDAWLLVLDTRGINVWCAAGKGTFGTREIISRVRQTCLSRVVDHCKLILPQLGAPGVAARQVRKGCGFEVIWGPVRAADLPAFLEGGCVAEESMRQVTFSMGDRMVLVPVELTLARKPLLWTLLVAFLLSGVGPRFFSFSMAWDRGLLAAAASAAGILAGCVGVPLLLPWIPGRAFAFKGALAGLFTGLAAVFLSVASPYVGLMSAAALLALATTVSSYLAMNFTGTTPFTSPSGVEKEMRLAIPLQLAGVLLAAGLWIAAAFTI
jgi:CO dehydrogenase/acetyl-CoA synthase delta subunit